MARLSITVVVGAGPPSTDFPLSTAKIVDGGLAPAMTQKDRQSNSRILYDSAFYRNKNSL